MGNVFFNKNELVEINTQTIVQLKQVALNSPHQTARLCLHKNLDDILHEMIIVHRKSKYVRPHKHEEKTETVHVIEGSFLLVVYDDNGQVIKKILMGKADEMQLLCRLEKGIWHMIIPLTDFIVFHEITNGSYTGKGDSLFASWAPEEGNNIEVKKFVENILTIKMD